MWLQQYSGDHVKLDLIKIALNLIVIAYQQEIKIQTGETSQKCRRGTEKKVYYRKDACWYYVCFEYFLFWNDCTLSVILYVRIENLLWIKIYVYI